jgi:hypothetical protein
MRHNLFINNPFHSSIVAVGILATVMALTINSIYGLWYLCADLVSFLDI